MRRKLWLQWLHGLLLMQLTATEAYDCSTFRQFAWTKQPAQRNKRSFLVGVPAHARRQTSLLALPVNNIQGDELQQSVPQTTVPHSFRRTPQTRRLTVSRRPKYYWQKIGNVEREIEDFWTNLGIQRNETLCIPNEALCKYLLLVCEVKYWYDAHIAHTHSLLANPNHKTLDK